MTSAIKQNKYKLWFLVVFLGSTLLFCSYFINYRSIKQLEFSWQTITTQQIHRELRKGKSPNGTLETVFGGSNTEDMRTKLSTSPANFRYAVIKEVSKEYATGTVRLDGEFPIPQGDFLDITKAQGINHTYWEPIAGERLAISSRTYDYGDVSGYIIVGQSSKPFQDMQSSALRLTLVLWVIMAVCSGIFIFGSPTTSALKAQL